MGKWGLAILDKLVESDEKTGTCLHFFRERRTECSAFEGSTLSKAFFESLMYFERGAQNMVGFQFSRHIC